MLISPTSQILQLWRSSFSPSKSFTAPVPSWPLQAQFPFLCPVFQALRVLLLQFVRCRRSIASLTLISRSVSHGLSRTRRSFTRNWSKVHSLVLQFNWNSSHEARSVRAHVLVLSHRNQKNNLKKFLDYYSVPMKPLSSCINPKSPLSVF